MAEIAEIINNIKRFKGSSLANRLSDVEAKLNSSGKEAVQQICTSLGVNATLFSNAITIKEMAQQIDEVVHSVGVLILIPKILNEDEIIEYASLGAGNTGKPFDMETNLRIAEFQFANWRGETETIRQNSLFKDFYRLAEYNTTKRRYLYVWGSKLQKEFLMNSGRQIRSVFSHEIDLWSDFKDKYGNRFSKVKEYCDYRSSLVKVVDILDVIG